MEISCYNALYVELYSFFDLQLIIKISKYMLIRIISILIFSLFSFSGFSQIPEIEIWYGDNQKFGHLGNPQKWINILGNVSDQDGIKSLHYSLNNGSEVE